MELNLTLFDEQFLHAAQALVAGAEDRIWISTFKAEITTKPRGRRLNKFFDTLIQKVHQGVEVRFLLPRPAKTNYVPDSNLYAITALKRGKVEVRSFFGNRLCHAKIIFVDNDEAILGSHNLSVKSCHNNFECSVSIIDKFTLLGIQNGYEKAWLRSQKI